MLQRLGRVQGVTANLCRQLHILQGRQILHQIVKLKHKADVIAAVGRQLPGGHAADPDPVHLQHAAGTGIHAPQHIEHRRFARAGGTHNDGKFPLLNVKGHAIHRPDDHFAHAVLLPHVLKGNIVHMRPSRRIVLILV